LVIFLTKIENKVVLKIVKKKTAIDKDLSSETTRRLILHSKELYKIL